MLSGYTRVSTDDQCMDLQKDGFTKAGCDCVLEHRLSGAKAERPDLKAALDYARQGESGVWTASTVPSFSMTASVTNGIRKRFSETLERKKHANESVAAGREFVEAYVDYTHYLERLYNDAVGQAPIHAKPDENKANGGHAH